MERSALFELGVANGKEAEEFLVTDRIREVRGSSRPNFV